MYAIFKNKNATSKELALAEVLILLSKAYEDKIVVKNEPNPVDMVKYLMSKRDVRPIDMVPVFGSRSVASEVLAGKRGLSLTMIRNMAEFFRVSTDMFIEKITKTRPSKTARVKASNKRRPVSAQI